jgi:mRNA-degrading endonuclease toxin of MazEF toxin-antitoxin module
MYGNSTPIIGTFTTAFVPCDVPTTLNVTGATYNQATVSWALVSGGLTYTIEYKPTTSSTWSLVSTSSNSILLTGLTSATLYDVRVKANCTAGISTYITSQFTTYSATCPAWGVNNSEYIDLFALGTINRTSGREIGGYLNTNLTTNLVKGSTTVGQFSAGYNPGIIFGENFAVYIDFNNNGSFADAGERVVAPTYVTSGSATYNFNVTIPNNASTGVRKMRVIICRSTSTIAPCQFTNFKGEVEDYKVNIVNNGNRMAASSNNNSNILIADEIVEKIIVFPNPSTGNFNIKMPQNSTAAYYEVISINGAIIEKKNIEAANSFTIDLSNQTNGLYLLNIISADENKHFTQRINLMK